MKNLFQKSILSFAVVFFLTSAAYSAEQCSNLFDRLGPEKIVDVLTTLQKERFTLGNANDFDSYIKPSGGGSCATITGFNAIQSWLILNGLPQIEKPKTVIAQAYEDIPELKDGRVTSPQMMQLLKYLSRAIPVTEIEIKSLQESTMEDVFNKPGQTLILTYKISNSGEANENGIVKISKTRGRHFVLLKQRQDQTITVVDPYKTTKDYKYNLQNITLETPEGNVIPAVQLIGPTGSDVYTLDEIFTIQTKN